MENSIDGVDLTGKHVVLKEDAVTAAYRDVTWRVIRASGGFGCTPGLSGRAVFAEHVRDGEKARWHRSQIERLATADEILSAAALRKVDAQDAKSDD